MSLLHGALDRPQHPVASQALDFAAIRVGSPAPTNWFTAWNWPATGNIMANDVLSDCVEVADIVLVEGFRLSRGLSPLSAAELTDLAKLRYEMVSGWNGVIPGNDPGSVTQVDAFSWASAPIIADGQSFPVAWATVPVAQVSDALRRGPLAITLGLTATDADDPDLWQNAPQGAYADFHRVVCGAGGGGLLLCRTYGRDVLVSPARVVGADLFVPLSQPESLQMAGIDFSALST